MNASISVFLPVDGRRIASRGLERIFLDGIGKFLEYRRATGHVGAVTLYSESLLASDFASEIKKHVSSTSGFRLIEKVSDLRTVFRATATDAAVFWRAESGIPPKEMELVRDALLEKGVQAVVGSRFIKGAIRRNLSGTRGIVLKEFLAAWCFAYASGVRLSDPMAGLWALKAVWLEGLPNRAVAAGLASCAVAAARKGKAPIEIPVMWAPARPSKA